MKKTCPVCKKEIENDLKFCPFCGYCFPLDTKEQSETPQDIQVPSPAISVPKKNSNKVLILVIGLIIALIATIIALGFSLSPHISNAIQDFKEGFRDGYNSVTAENSEDYVKPEVTTSQTALPNDYYNLDAYCFNFATEEYREYQEVIENYAYALETKDFDTYKEVYADTDKNLYSDEDLSYFLKERRQQFVDDAGSNFTCYAVIYEEERIRISGASEIQKFLDENNLDLAVLDCYNLNFTIFVTSEFDKTYKYTYDFTVYETQDGWYIF